MKHRFYQLACLSMCLIFICQQLNACTALTSDPPPPRKTPSMTEVLQRGGAFLAITSANEEAWNVKDLDAIEDILTEDIHFVDVTFGDDLVGKKQVLKMARSFCDIYPDLQRKTTSLYIGTEEGIVFYDYWGWKFGSIEYTLQDPWDFIFHFRTHADLISYWRLFEGIDILESHFISETESKEIRTALSSYGSAWSSGDSKIVAGMYAKDAVRQDSLFNESQQGRRAIKTFAESFFTWYPNTQWTPLEMFGERPFNEKPHTIGSSFAIQTSYAKYETCTIKAVVLLQVLEGEIVQEDLYYDVKSLIGCGWTSLGDTNQW